MKIKEINDIKKLILSVLMQKKECFSILDKGLGEKQYLMNFLKIMNVENIMIGT